MPIIITSNTKITKQFLNKLFEYGLEKKLSINENIRLIISLVGKFISIDQMKNGVDYSYYQLKDETLENLENLETLETNEEQSSLFIEIPENEYETQMNAISNQRLKGENIFHLENVNSKKDHFF